MTHFILVWEAFTFGAVERPSQATTMDSIMNTLPATSMMAMTIIRASPEYAGMELKDGTMPVIMENM